MALSLLGIGLLIGLLVFAGILAWAAWGIGAGGGGLSIFFLVLGILGVTAFALTLILLANRLD